ncbi:MAG: hypothetical protein MI810_16680 [Flavobacteriales bacterium]|jgi:hypothetical protein|nr:hypothetical protein [Flavobacteriales bacterium]
MKRNKIIKLEIILPAVYTQKLIYLFETFQVTGYSAVEIVLGRGEKHGAFESDGLLSTGKSLLFFSVLDKNHFLQLRKELKDFLHEYGGAYVLTDVLEATNLKPTKNE